MAAVEVRRVPSLFITSIMLCVVGLFLFIALINGHRDLAVLSLLVFIMAGGLKLWSCFCFSRVQCNLSIDRMRVFAGEKLVLTLYAGNGKPLPVMLEASVPVDGLSYDTVSEGSSLKGEESLLWYQDTKFQWELTASARGVYRVGPVGIASGDLFGFFVKEKKIEETIQVVVYPKLVPLAPFSLQKRDFFGVPGDESPVNDPVYVLGTTDYHHGRPAKHIHWKASARHNNLQEKVFEPTQQEKILIVVDVDQFAQDYANEFFERTLEAVASMAVRLDRQGCAVGLLTNGIVGGGRQHLSITRGPGQIASILEMLARLEMVTREALIDTLQRTLNIPWGTSCAYFSLTENGAARAIKDYLRHRKIPVSHFAYDAVETLRKNTPVKLNNNVIHDDLNDDEGRKASREAETG